MKGMVHSIQSLGAVDGPGVRSVVFLQGCPIRCAYCHNPDTWEMNSNPEAMELESEELVKRLLRFSPYFGKTGGVTLSGGEPLMQPEFTAEVFKLLKEEKIHTALDTAGQASLQAAEQVLRYTDLALVDVKFLTEQEYREHTKGSLKKLKEFLELTAVLDLPVWIRHVAVPGLTAEPDYLRRVQEKAQKLPNLEKIEWLPFHKLCMEKYERLGIPFPLKDTPQLTEEELKKLLEQI